MFDMKEVGQRLSVMRKNAHLTQMELANKLGISYQAVSNWERGVSMPDIANIGPLAEALGVTVDDIIGNKKISSVMKGDPLEEKLTIDEFNAVSPLLEPEKNAELLRNDVNYYVTENHNGFTSETIDKTEINVSSLCLTQEEIDDLFRKAAYEKKSGLLAIFRSHASESVIEETFIYGVQNGDFSIVAILKNKVSEETLKKALYSSVESGNTALVSILMKAKKNKHIDDDEEDDDWDDDEEDDDWDDDEEDDDWDDDEE